MTYIVVSSFSFFVTKALENENMNEKEISCKIWFHFSLTLLLCFFFFHCLIFNK